MILNFLQDYLDFFKVLVTENSNSTFNKGCYQSQLFNAVI